MGKGANGVRGIRRRANGRYGARYTVQTATGPKRRTIYGKDYDDEEQQRRIADGQ